MGRREEVVVCHQPGGRGDETRALAPRRSACGGAGEYAGTTRRICRGAQKPSGCNSRTTIRCSTASPTGSSSTGIGKGKPPGFYVGYIDGHPAGYAKNNRTGEEVRWKAKGYTLNDEQRAALAAETATKLRLREQQVYEGQSEAARRVEQQLRGAKQARSTPYLDAKQVTATKGVFADKENKTLLVPGYDVDGKIWTTQYIQDDGTKRFAKGTRKEGCFHAIGGLGNLGQGPGHHRRGRVRDRERALSEATEQKVAVVSAFDAGNLEPVARALKEKFPEKIIIVAGDDDRLDPSKNPGREYATRAARAVDAQVIFPTFATGEQASDPKRFSDFCDVRANSRLGLDGLKEQIDQVVEQTLDEVEQKQTVERGQGEKVQKAERKARSSEVTR